MPHRSCLLNILKGINVCMDKWMNEFTEEINILRKEKGKVWTFRGRKQSVTVEKEQLKEKAKKWSVINNNMLQFQFQSTFTLLRVILITILRGRKSMAIIHVLLQRKKLRLRKVKWRGRVFQTGKKYLTLSNAENRNKEWKDYTEF